MKNIEIEEINKKANYCLNCKAKPCSQKGCPLGNNIPEFISNIKEGNIEKAYKILSETTVLPGICGRICPHKKQCQGSCIRGIKGEPVSIGELEAFVFDKIINEDNSLLKYYKKEIEEKKNNKKIAIIGGGPAGLTAAAFLARNGFKVTIYEKYNYLGGLLVHGIPEFRLPKTIVEKTVKKIITLGIEVKYNQELGKNLYLQDIEQKYDAIFLAIGANKSAKMAVEGENLNGVYGGNELLEYNLHPNYTNKTVAVIGGGNVAMDCARTAKRLGAKEVNIIYRRAREQMPAEDKEIEDAKREGIKFLFQNNIVKIIGTHLNSNSEKESYEEINEKTSNIANISQKIEKNEINKEKNCQKVEKIELIKTELVKKENDERLVPVNIENSNYTIDVDYIIMALGSNVEPYVKDLGLKTNKWGYIEINEKYETSNPKIYAGGDLAGIKSTVAWAANSGREAAKSIIEKYC